MTEVEQQELKEANAALLREKADAVAAWHKEVRDTLKKHTEELQIIMRNTTELPQLRANIATLETRVRNIEDFKIKAIFSMVVAFVLIGVFWKWIDRILP